MAIRSLMESVACQHIVKRRKFLQDSSLLQAVYSEAEVLVAKLHAMRNAIAPAQKWLREQDAEYLADADTP